MTTYKELIYIILDLVKGSSDDFSLNENHIAFLLNKYKGSLIAQKYKDSNQIDKSNFETICLPLEIESNCEEIILKASMKLPSYIGNLTIYTEIFDKISEVKNERFKYAGNGKFGARMIYSTIVPSNILYLKSRNRQLAYLKTVRISGVFLENTAKYSCETRESEELACADEFDRPFIIEEGLVPLLIQSVLNDILQASYRMGDSLNNGRDDLSDLYTLSQAIARTLKNGRKSTEDN